MCTIFMADISITSTSNFMGIEHVIVSQILTFNISLISNFKIKTSVNIIQLVIYL